MKIVAPLIPVALLLAVTPAFAQTPAPMQRQTPGQTTPSQTTPGQTPAGQTTPGQTTPGQAPASRPAPVEEVPRGETVMDRPRPDYDALGVRVGGFLLYPSLAVRQAFNSNVFATERNKKSDFITVVEPSVDLRSNWNNHMLEFHADAGIGRYWSQTTENYEDFTLAAAGRLDVTRDTQLFAGLGYRIRHEERSSPDDVGGKEPAEYALSSAAFGVQQSFNRLVFRLDAIADHYDFRRTPAFGGGSINQNGRDRDQYMLRLRTSYEIAPLREIYMLTSANWRDYRLARDGGGIDRDSDGFEIAAGIKYDLTGILFLDFALGFSRQTYDDRRLKTTQGPSGSLKLTWNVTRLTTVIGTLSREIEETTLTGSSSYFATKSELRVDHELLRNLILSGYVGYQQDSFEGIRRDDNYYRAGIGSKYFFNRNFSAEAAYNYRRRDTNVPNGDFNENVVFLRLVGKL